ncbi:MAG: N-acetylglutamate synthase, partial [Pseudonocardiales bacterium]|nr:N-acetylglutamate synthase [Pseudonocardiales bacterium]MDT4978102.1 N-acetylglutamate synthase [Pseudonocardiales bacterium]
AIGRGALDDEWLGVTAVEVAPGLRRQGLASVVMQALWIWGTAAGAQRSYVQVSSDNAAAVALYERLGYWRHHDYRYRTDPSQ